MKRRTYQQGTPGVKWGIWNTARKCWQFGISEDTPMLAEARLFQRIGDDARRWRFEVRPLPKEVDRIELHRGVYIPESRKESVKTIAEAFEEGRKHTEEEKEAET